MGRWGKRIDVGKKGYNKEGMEGWKATLTGVQSRLDLRLQSLAKSE